MNRRKKTRSGTGIVFVTVIALFTAITVKKTGLEARSRELHEKKTKCEEEIARLTEEEQRIEEYREYVDSDEYIEDIARKKLGLVYPDEIVFDVKE